MKKKVLVKVNFGFVGCDIEEEIEVDEEDDIEDVASEAVDSIVANHIDYSWEYVDESEESDE